MSKGNGRTEGKEDFTPDVVATVLSDKNGRYQLINLLPGEYLIRCQTPKGDIYYGERLHAEKHDPVPLQYLMKPRLAVSIFIWRISKREHGKAIRLLTGLQIIMSIPSPARRMA